MYVFVNTHLSVEVHNTETFDLALQWCQVPFATAHGQVEFHLPSGVHGVLQGLVGVSHPFFIQHGGIIQLVDLVQKL